jgi:hypothetical protein
VLERLPRGVSRRYLVVVLLLVGISAGSVLAGTRLQASEADAPAPIVRADGSLTADPEPLTIDDLNATRGPEPARAAMRLWFWAQWGSLPNVVAAHDPEVIDALGAEDIASAYRMMRTAYVSARPRILSVSRGRSGTVVTLEALRRNTAPTRYAFTMRERDGRWYITFDELLEEGIAAWVQFRATPDPSADKPPAAAVRAGIDAARRYRLAAVEAGATGNGAAGAEPRDRQSR